MVLAADRQQGISALHLVDNRLYTDQRAFELERERIFERVWNFYCHESELADPGTYLTKDVAGNPIVVVRNARGELRGYYNTCRHRGALVVAQERGRCATLRCPYHWWTYSLDGELLNVPGPEAYEGSGWCKDDFGLVPARVESVYGLVFVCLDPDAPALVDFIGAEALTYLHQALGAGELEVFHRHDLPVQANWKGWAENARDGYHVPCVHPFFLKHSPPREFRLLPNGHAYQRLGMNFEGMDPDLAAKLQKVPLPGFEVGDGFILMLFPDLGVTVRSNMVSILSQVPLSPGETIMEDRVLGLRGDSEEVRALRLLNWQTWFNNPVEGEDHPIFEMQQRGLQGKGVRYSFIGRGADATTGTRGDDNRLRQFWARWRDYMGVERNAL